MFNTEFDPFEFVDEQFEGREESADELGRLVERSILMGLPVLAFVDFGDEGTYGFSFDWDECDCPPEFCRFDDDPEGAPEGAE